MQFPANDHAFDFTFFFSRCYYQNFIEILDFWISSQGFIFFRSFVFPLLLVFVGCSYRYYAGDLQPLSESQQGENKEVADDGTVTKTGKSGYSSTRVIGTIIHIAQHYIISRQPHVLLFTGAKDENRGPIYTKLTHLAFKSLKDSSLEGYEYFIDDSDRHNVRFWIYKEKSLPYLGDENFQKRMSNKWQQQNPGLDNVYEQ